jgi:hypothetical protein
LVGTDYRNTTCDTAVGNGYVWDMNPRERESFSTQTAGCIVERQGDNLFRDVCVCLRVLRSLMTLNATNLNPSDSKPSSNTLAPSPR